MGRRGWGGAVVLLLTGCRGCDERTPLPDELVFDEPGGGVASRRQVSEWFALSGLNASAHERHRLDARRVHTTLAEPVQVTESHVLDDRLDLLVVIDDSSSMADEKAAFVDAGLDDFLDGLTGGRLDALDLRVRFLGAGPDGHEAALPLGGPAGEAVWDDLLLEPDGSAAYPGVRDVVAAREGLLTDDALDDWLRDRPDGDPWIVPPVLGDADFVADFGAPGLLGEWFALYTVNALLPATGGTPQHHLAGNVLRHVDETVRDPHRTFLRPEVPLAVLLITDDVEGRATDPAAPETALDWEDWAPACDGAVDRDGDDAEAACRIDDWATRAVAALRDDLGHDAVVFFDLSCVAQDAPAFGQCARGSRTDRPPFARLAALTGGAHVELPADGPGFLAAVDAFAQRLQTLAFRRVVLDQAPVPGSIALTVDGLPVPPTVGEDGRGWVCADQACRVLEIVGYDVEAVAPGATAEVTFQPASDDGALDGVTLPVAAEGPPRFVFQAGRGLEAGVDWTWDPDANRVALTPPGTGSLTVHYTAVEPVPTWQVLLRQLPFPNTLTVLVDGERLSACRTEVETGCWSVLTARGLEIVREAREGTLWPPRGAEVEVVYAAEDRFPRADEGASRALFLAWEPSGPDGIDLVQLGADGDGVRVDPSTWTYDAARRAVVLATPAPAGTRWRVDYDRAAPALAPPPGDREALQALVDRVADTPIVRRACDGEGVVDGRDTRAGLAETLDAALAPTTVGPWEEGPWGPARRVEGFAARGPLWLHEGRWPSTCADDPQAMAASRLLAESTGVLVGERAYAPAICPVLEAFARCPEVNQVRQLGYLLGEVGRHAEVYLPDQPDAAEIHLRAAVDLHEALLETWPGDPVSAVNLAFARWQLAERGADPDGLAAAEALLVGAATSTQSAALHDVLAMYADRVFRDGEAMIEAMVRAEGIAGWMLSQRASEAWRGPAARGGGGGKGGVYQGAFSAGWSTGEVLAECTPLVCVPFECALEVRLMLGIHPAATIGVAVKDAAEYAICELITAECTCDAAPDDPTFCFQPLFQPSLEVLAGALSLSSAANPMGLGFTLQGDGTVDYQVDVGVDVPGRTLDDVGFNLGVAGTVGVCEDGGADVALSSVMLGLGAPLEAGFVASHPGDDAASVEAVDLDDRLLQPPAEEAEKGSAWPWQFSVPALEDGDPLCEDLPKPRVCDEERPTP